MKQDLALAALDAVRTTTVTDLHAYFHRSAAQVLEAVVRGDSAGARECMRNSDGYAGAAPYLMDALMDWLAAVER